MLHLFCLYQYTTHVVMLSLSKHLLTSFILSENQYHTFNQSQPRFPLQSFFDIVILSLSKDLFHGLHMLRLLVPTIREAQHDIWGKDSNKKSIFALIGFIAQTFMLLFSVNLQKP